MSGWRPRGDAGCEHAAGFSTEVAPASECEDCVREGTTWTKLRRCLACQHVGCCDSSTGQHATAHWPASGHPVMASAERGDRWGWCYPDKLWLVPAN
jgi:hypothetical protein